MRAPDNKRHATRERHLGRSERYSAPQREAIKTSLIDASIPSEVTDAICDKVQRIAWTKSLLSLLQHAPTRVRGPTPKQQAAETRKELAEIDTTIEVLGRCAADITFFHEGLTEDQRRRDCKKLNAPLGPLMAERARLQQRLDKLSGPVSGGHRPDSRKRNSSASQTYTDFLKELMSLWLAITAKYAARQRHKDLIAFLQACAHPVFPTAVKASTEHPTMLVAFVERHLPQMKT
jgi:hypothetical protein